MIQIFKMIMRAFPFIKLGGKPTSTGLNSLGSFFIVFLRNSVIIFFLVNFADLDKSQKDCLVCKNFTEDLISSFFWSATLSFSRREAASRLTDSSSAWICLVWASCLARSHWAWLLTAPRWIFKILISSKGENGGRIGFCNWNFENISQIFGSCSLTQVTNEITLLPREQKFIAYGLLFLKDKRTQRLKISFICFLFVKSFFVWFSYYQAKS